MDRVLPLRRTDRLKLSHHTLHLSYPANGKDKDGQMSEKGEHLL